ncbi:MAG: FAD-dependent pyridine nucleotide-disulfide oxidoreductase [Solirubrobacterales bacterium]|nr:FAD-dependent pyridine nucleotide-disulfide oxidoreductase [Solirubrobacterales bacterium]
MDQNTPSVAIIGCGFGGLAAAIELKRAGIENFVVLERAAEVGGVWQANTYPGAQCDVPSVIYQFSHALSDDWSQRFGDQSEIRDYLRRVSVDSGVRDHVRFECEVLAAAFDEDAGTWTLELAGGEQLVVTVLICATGQLSRPKLPDVPGRDTFAGHQFHSAQWEHDVELDGKRVVVVGGGATAIQVVPAIADQDAHLTVVQRSPSWVLEKRNWTPTRVEKTLMRRVPLLLRAYHNATWWWFEARYPLVLRKVDPIRRGLERRRLRQVRKVVEDPAKRAAITPDYPLGCNRILLSSDWYPTLAREDVDVIGAAVASVGAHSVTTSDGRVIPTDVIVWCTGFAATEFLSPMRITGRDGQDIRDAWKDGPEAYLGLSARGFPNLFMSYGPNTGSLTNTIIYLLERQAAYMRQAIQYLATSSERWIDVRDDVHRDFNDELQQRMTSRVFTAGCPGWYTTDAGKVTQVWVGSHVEYGRRTRHFEPALYEHASTARAGDRDQFKTVAA